MLLTTFTRGAWIGGFVALVVVAFAAARGKARLETPEWVALGAAAAGIAAIVIRSLRSSSVVTNVVARLTSIFDSGAGALERGFSFGMLLRKSVSERPLTGTGPDTFVMRFPALKSAEYVAIAGHNNFADNVHSYPLQLASGVGIPGAVAMYTTVVWALAVSARQAFAKNGLDRLALAGMWAGVVGYLVHLMFGDLGAGLHERDVGDARRTRCANRLCARVSSPSWGRIAGVVTVALCGRRRLGAFARRRRLHVRARLVRSRSRQPSPRLSRRCA